MSFGSFIGGIGGAIKLGAHTYGPHICVGLGVLGFVSTCVMVAKETPKALEIMEETDYTIKDLKEEIKMVEEKRPENTEELDWLKKEITRTYFRCAGGVAKTYLPAVITGVMSCGCILGGHFTIARRLSGMGVAFNSLFDSYNSYRERVREAVGEEEEVKLYRGLIEEEHGVVDTETGEITTKTGLVPAWKKGCGAYSFVFSQETSTAWEKNRNYLLAFLQQQESYWNKVLQGEIGHKYHGHVILFDVLDELGLLNKNSVNKMTDAQIRAFRDIGWLKEKRMNKITKQYDIITGNGNTGDGYISFGIQEDPFDPFTFYLDFNVDGVILHDITRWLE